MPFPVTSAMLLGWIQDRNRAAKARAADSMARGAAPGRFAYSWYGGTPRVAAY